MSLRMVAEKAGKKDAVANAKIHVAIDLGTPESPALTGVYKTYSKVFLISCR
jgi:hypothetical protein